MRIMIKFFILVIGLILIAMAVGLWFFRGAIESRITGQLAANLERHLGTKVRIEGFGIAAGGRALALDGLSLYATDIEHMEDAFIARFEKILMYPAYSTLFSERRVIHRLVFVDPVIHVRHTGGLTTNINAVGRHIRASKQEMEALPPQAQRTKKEFLIHTMEVFPAEVTLSTSLPLPAIPLTTEKLVIEELASESLTMPELLNQIHAALSRALWNLPGLSRFQDNTGTSTAE